jgi:hypothetical protein
MINTQERAAVTDAAARIHASSVHAAAVVAAADQHAATTVERAAAESHQRVAEADAAVGALTDLRSQLLGQLGMLGAHLDQVRTLVAQAAPIVVPPEQEADRPVTAHFPPDPTGRPTPPPGFDPEPPQWAVPEQEPFVPPSAMAARETEEAHVDDGTESADAPAATASPTDSNDLADPADPADTTDSADPANTTDPAETADSADPGEQHAPDDLAEEVVGRARPAPARQRR